MKLIPGKEERGLAMCRASAARKELEEGIEHGLEMRKGEVGTRGKRRGDVVAKTEPAEPIARGGARKRRG